MSKILIVDDEERIRKLVSDFLKRAGYETLCAEDGYKALEVFDQNINDINLIILDIMMPYLDGWEVCEQIRKESNVPIIMLTAKIEEENQLKGYELKVDDYILKPFSPKLVTAKIEAILRRCNTDKNSNTNIITKGLIAIDLSSRTLYVENNPVELSLKEFELVHYFIENENIALSREMILDKVWNYDFYGDARTIDTHIKKLRQKLGNAKDYIKTIYGYGYKFNLK